LSITTHRIWQDVVPFIRVNMRYNNGKYGPVCDAVYVNGAPDWLVAKLIAVRMPCVRCRSVISPFRARTKDSDDNREHPHYIYLSSTCQMAEPGREGCCRSKASSQEKQAILAKLAADNPTAINTSRAR